MIEAYEQVRPQPKTLAYFSMINKVLEDIFVRQGYRLSVRQLFYRLVARGLIKNTKPNYDFLTRQVRDGGRGATFSPYHKDFLMPPIIPYLLVKIWRAKMHLKPLSSFWGPAQVSQRI